MGDALSGAAAPRSFAAGVRRTLDRGAYVAVWLAGNALFRTYFRLRAENTPRLRGPYVVVANHASMLDPLFLAAVQRRRVCYLMSEIFYRSPRLGWLYRLAKAIPVSLRGSNRTAIAAARTALARGDVVGVFPEGGLSRDGGLYLGQPGAVSLVLASGVPVLPAGILGAGRAFGHAMSWPRPRRVTVRFGAAIAPQDLHVEGGASRKAQLGATTARLMAEIAALCETRSREAELASAATHSPH